jgi:DNA-binding GntR family transcriptional regulator
MLLRDTIYLAIRQAILTCEFQPGQELREQALAERYRASRSPVRDSLLRLEKEELVTVLPRQGYRVNPILMSDVADILSFRLLIEPASAMAAARADDTAVQALDRFRGFGEQDHSGFEFLEYNRSFHCAVADLSGNMRMAAVFQGLLGQYERLVLFSGCSFDHQTMRCSCAEHEAIIDALQANDADGAFRLAYEHVDGSHSRLRLRLAASRPEGEIDDHRAPDARQTAQACGVGSSMSIMRS